MAFSYYNYTGDGTTTQFPVAFGYIRREHVLAAVAGAPVTFTFVNSTTIQMDAVPANGAVVRVYRQTPLTAPLVNFTDGATLVAADLDANALQSIYTQQELDDSLVDGLADVIPNGDKGDITTSASGSVWTIDAGAITETKVATGAITETKVATGAITETKVGTGAITTAKLASVIAPVVSSLNGGPLAGTRNRIINGDMRIAQRGTSFAAIASGAYSLDRWLFGYAGAMVCTVSQSTDVPNNTFQSSYKIDVTTADTSIAASDLASIAHRIEGYNVRDLIGTTFTLSFWVKSPKTGVHCVSFRNVGTGSPVIPDRSYVKEYTVVTANTWEYKTLTISGGLITAGTWDWTNGVGIYLDFFLAAGSTFHTTADAWQTGNFYATANQVNVMDNTSNDFFLTGVQLEPGSVATPFEQRPIGTELALCQRYFQLAGNGCFGSVDGSSTTVIAFAEKFFVPMRTAPTVTWTTGQTAIWRYLGGDVSNGGSTSLANTISTVNGVWSQQSGYSGLSANAPVYSRNSTSDGRFMSCNAEL